MTRYKLLKLGVVSTAAFWMYSCAVPKQPQRLTDHKDLVIPTTFDTLQTGNQNKLSGWRLFFTNQNLQKLIEIALENNQELNVTLQEIEIAKSEVLYKKSGLSPKVTAGIGVEVEKVGRYTSQGAGDASTEIEEGKETPDPLFNFQGAIRASWEVDIWNKLHHSKEAAVHRFLATVEGRNFVLTNLISEIAEKYYDLIALDNQLQIVENNINLQRNALELVKIQKQAARATALAVKKFEAELMKSESMVFGIKQEILETENSLNFLMGRYPTPIVRTQKDINDLNAPTITAGIPADLLENRPDIARATHQLEASKLDVQVAKAEFYPGLGLSAAVGLEAFKPNYLTKLPESLLYNVIADITGPLVNKKAIKAEYNKANAAQLQALYNYERTVLTAFLEVSNGLKKIDNLEQSYQFKLKQIKALNESIDMATLLYKSNRAEYLEVLMTQRDALEAKLELVETKTQQFKNVISVYKNLGGGWK